MKYLFDLSALSGCAYTPSGRAYGIGRVTLGLAVELNRLVGEELGFSSWLYNAECPILLQRRAPELFKSCVEQMPGPIERAVMRRVQACARQEGGLSAWSKSPWSKALRRAWSSYDDGWKVPKRSGGRRAMAEASVLHGEYLLEFEKVKRGPAILATLHDLIPLHEGHPQQGPRIMQRLESLDRVGAHFITGSRFAAEDLEAHFPQAAGRIHWFQDALDDVFKPCGDEAAVLQWRTTLGLGPEAPYFVAQTGIQKRKNLPGAVRAVHRLREETGTGFQLVLAGYSLGVAELLDAELKDVADWRKFVRLTGALDDEQFAPLYAGAVALIFLSRDEGFGYAPLEAMGCGLPAVGSNRTSIPEVIGDAGPVFDPDDLDGVCAELLRLYEDTAYRADRVRRSLNQAARFTWKRAAAKVFSVWQELDGTPPGRPAFHGPP